MHALYIVVPALCILAIAYRYYSAFIAAKVWCWTTRASRRRTRSTTAPTTTRPAVGAVRPPLRGHHRRRAAGRPGAGGAVRLRARLHLAASPASASPARCTTRSALWASTRRGGRSLAEIARTEIGPVAGVTGRHRDPLHPRRRAGRPRHRRRQRAGRQRVGHVHHRHDHPARHVHGLLHVQVAQGPDQGSDDHRRHADAAGRGLRQERRRVVRSATGSSCRTTR